MKILLFGKSGQVGAALQRTLPALGELIALGRAEQYDDGKQRLTGDITDLASIEEMILSIQPDVVVNAAAYTAVDQAETEQQQAWLVNAQAVSNLARACQQVNALLVHYSTDYIFDGQASTPYTEDMPAHPVNIYGKSKWQGERQIIASQCNHLIFRTSWIYSSHGHNFIKTILGLARYKKELQVVDDQTGVPTSAEWIAEVTVQVINTYFQDPEPVTLNGIYHLVPSGAVSWFGYANKVIEQARSLGAKLAIEQIISIPSSSYLVPARRPLNSRLDTQKLQTIFAVKVPHWQQDIPQVIQEILQHDFT